MNNLNDLTSRHMSQLRTTLSTVSFRLNSVTHVDDSMLTQLRRDTGGALTCLASLDMLLSQQMHGRDAVQQELIDIGIHIQQIMGKLDPDLIQRSQKFTEPEPRTNIDGSTEGQYTVDPTND